MVDGHKIQTIWNIATLEYRNLLRSTKMIVLGMFVIFINIQIITPLKGCAVLMDEKLSFPEAFVALGNSGIVVLILPLLYLVMMADFPRQDGGQLFLQIRCGKTVWALGQVVFAFLSAVSMSAFALVSSVVLLGSYGKWDMDFSYAVTKFVYTYPERSGDYVVLLLPGNLYNQITLGKAVLHTFVLLTLYFFLIALILLLSSVMGSKLAGIVITGILIVAGMISWEVNTAFMWFLPMANALAVAHFREYLSAEVFPLAMSYVYFVIVNLGLIIACAIRSKHYQIF